MASLYRNGIYWYLASGGTACSTGMRTSDYSKRDAQRKIGMMPDGHRLKSMLFDKPLAKKYCRIRVSAAFQEYEATVNGLGPDGLVVDARQRANWTCSIASQIKHVKAQFGDRYLDQITDTDVLRWIQQLRGQSLKPETVKKYVYRLSSLFKFGRSKYRGWVQSNPVTDQDGAVQAEFKRNRDVWTYQGREVGVMADQVQRLREASAGISRAWDFFMTLELVVGGRRRELLTLQKKHVDFEARHVTIEGRNAKTRSSRRVHFGWSEPLVAFFSEFCFGKQADDYIFSQDGKAPYTGTWATKNFAKAASAAHLPGHLTLRDFRHVSAQEMEAKGVSVTTIARQLGTSVRLLQHTYLKQPETAIEAELRAKLG